MTTVTQLITKPSFSLLATWRMDTMAQVTASTPVCTIFCRVVFALVLKSTLGRGFLLAAKMQVWMPPHLRVN